MFIGDVIKDINSASNVVMFIREMTWYNAEDPGIVAVWLIPVDIYLPGCPPRPEDLIDAVLQIQRIVEQESISPKRQSGAIAS